jgi:hypothetical protein
MPVEPLPFKRAKGRFNMNPLIIRERALKRFSSIELPQRSPTPVPSLEREG